MPQGPKANKAEIAFIVSLALMRLILGYTFFEKIGLPGANLTVLPILVVALTFPDKYNARAFRKTIPFTSWALLAYIYSYIYGARDIVTLLNYIDTIGAMYLLIFFFELCLAKAEPKGLRVDVYKWIWILLVINTVGYSLSDGDVKYQLFSSQIIPIAAVSLQNPLFYNDNGMSAMRRYFLGGSSIMLLYMSEARAALIASACVFACGCIFQGYSRVSVPGRLDFICKAMGNLALPRSAKGIEIGVTGCFIGYFVCLTFLFNNSYLSSKGLSYNNIADQISRIEKCNYTKTEGSTATIDSEICNRLNEEPGILRDVSVLVRFSSDAFFARSAIKDPIRLLLPEISATEKTLGTNYINRSHNLIIHLIKFMGIPSALLLLNVLRQYIRRLEAMTIPCPTIFPIIVLSLFTLNDINYSIPFLVL